MVDLTTLTIAEAARRMGRQEISPVELTQAALRESLLEDDLDPFRVIVETLTDEFDLMEVALAAVKLAHEVTSPGSDDEEEIPQVAVRPPRDCRHAETTFGLGDDDDGAVRPVFQSPGRRAQRCERMTELLVWLMPFHSRIRTMTSSRWVVFSARMRKMPSASPVTV